MSNLVESDESSPLESSYEGVHYKKGEQDEPDRGGNNRNPRRRGHRKRTSRDIRVRRVLKTKISLEKGRTTRLRSAASIAHRPTMTTREAYMDDRLEGRVSNGAIALRGLRREREESSQRFP